MNSYDIDFDLIFCTPDRVAGAENHADKNCIPEESKHSDDSTVTREEAASHSPLTSQVHVERISVSTGDQVKGEHLSSTIHHDNHDSIFEREHVHNHDNVEGGHLNSNPLVE